MLDNTSYLVSPGPVSVVLNLPQICSFLAMAREMKTTQPVVRRQIYTFEACRDWDCSSGRNNQLSSPALAKRGTGIRANS